MKKAVLLVLLSILFLIFLNACSLQREEFSVSNYDMDKSLNGTNLFFDHNNDAPRIVEMDMNANIVWEYYLEGEMKNHVDPGFDVEVLENGNLQLLAPGYGIFEMTREGEIVWEYYDNKISHDADRLDNGNILFAYGNFDTPQDAQAREITLDGDVVWEWYAKDNYSYDVSCSGFTHTNAVERLDNGNTLVSLRNFNFIVEVSPEGEVVKEIGKGVVYSSHDPQVHNQTTITVASQYPKDCYLTTNPDNFIGAMELDLDSQEIVWQYSIGEWAHSSQQLIRDVNKLENGNYLIAGTNKVIEVTSEGEIVWELEMNRELDSLRGFYKVERLTN